MTKEKILGQKIYQDGINEFVSKSVDFDNAVKDYRQNNNPSKEKELEKKSRSAWASYCYQMSYLLYLADNIKDEDGTAAAEAAKDLRKIVFENLQGKYEFIMFLTKPQNP